VKITGNVSLITPEHRFFWATANDSDTIALRDLASVMFGWQTRPDDETIEKTVRRWCYERNFTGYDELDVGQELYAGHSHLAWNVVQWLRSYQHVNNGLGPTIGCTTLAVAYVGLLAGQGIPARLVHGAYGRDMTSYDAVDNAAEYWSSKWGKWILVVPHCGFHLEYSLSSMPSGLPLSYYELVQLLRLSDEPHSEFSVVPIIGNGTAKHIDFNPHGWAPYTGVALWASGNRTVLRNVTSESGMWKWRQLFPPLAGDTIAPGDVLNVSDRSDIEVTPNALNITVTHPTNTKKEALVAMTHSMIDSGSEYQQFENGQWGVCGDRRFIRMMDGKEFKFRMLGPLGNTSNVVTVRLRGKAY